MRSLAGKRGGAEFCGAAGGGNELPLIGGGPTGGPSRAAGRAADGGRPGGGGKL